MTSASAIDRDAVLATLDKVIDPRSGRGLVAAGLVQGLVIREGTAGFMLEVPAADAGRYGYIREQAETALKALPGIDKAQVVLTAEAPAGVTRQRKTARLSPDPKSEPKASEAEKPAHVKRVIAVARPSWLVARLRRVVMANVLVLIVMDICDSLDGGPTRDH